MEDTSTLKIYTDQISKDFKLLEADIKKRKIDNEDNNLEMIDHKSKLTDNLQNIKNSVILIIDRRVLF